MSYKVGTHEGTSPCDYSLQLVPWSVYTLGLVARTIHTKLLEELVAGTCSKNSNWFELYSPRNDPDPEMIPNPEMIPTFLLVDPEMIPKELGNGD